ncbi:MAG: hypothetical protein IH987_08550 [Planctomycetes bacterium]|nr:hypothetical protein [Planctomycetota bacterium]
MDRLYEVVRDGGKRKLKRLLRKTGAYTDGACLISTTCLIQWRSDEMRSKCIEVQKGRAGDDGYESRWAQALEYRDRIKMGETFPPLHVAYVKDGCARLIDGARRCMALLEAGHPRHDVTIIFPQSLLQHDVD